MAGLAGGVSVCGRLVGARVELCPRGNVVALAPMPGWLVPGAGLESIYWRPMKRILKATLSAFFAMNCTAALAAATTVFFNASQIATHVASGDTSETVKCSGYVFTYSLDKYWYPGINIGPGTPTGRFQSVVWPSGLHAQAITAGPSGPVTTGGGATVTIKRADGTPFDLKTLTTKLLANTAGAGGAFEIMPQLNGNDAFPDPLALDATGYGGQTFTYATPSLIGFDTYQINLYVDFALTGVTFEGAEIPQPTLTAERLPDDRLRLSWPSSFAEFVLESAPALPAPSWTSVTNAVAPLGNLNSVVVGTGTTAQLYRLRGP